jgi:hypothetical protein
MLEGCSKTTVSHIKPLPCFLPYATIWYTHVTFISTDGVHHQVVNCKHTNDGQELHLPWSLLMWSAMWRWRISLSPSSRVDIMSVMAIWYMLSLSLCRPREWWTESDRQWCPSPAWMAGGRLSVIKQWVIIIHDAYVGHSNMTAVIGPSCWYFWWSSCVNMLVGRYKKELKVNPISLLKLSATSQQLWQGYWIHCKLFTTQPSTCLKEGGT